MKKFKLILISFFSLLIFMFGIKLSNPVFAEQNTATDIDTTVLFQSLNNAEGEYVLTRDLDFANVTNYSPIIFRGILDGNGYCISNITINLNNASSGCVGIFSELINATIKNISFKGIRILCNNGSVTTVNKLGLIAGNMSGSIISNCMISNSIIGEDDDAITRYSSLNVSTTSSIFAGSVCGNACDGSIISNVYSVVDTEINQQGIDTSKQFFVGGIVGKISSSEISNCFANNRLIKISTIVTQGTGVGGIVGGVLGNKTKIKNSICISNFENNFEGYIGSIIGVIDYPNDMPLSNAISNLYTTSPGISVGNTSDLNIGVPDFLYNCTNSISMADLKTKDFYISQENWDDMYEWDFDSTWQIEERFSFPVLQVFELFTYSFSEDNCFISLNKPVLSEPIIVLTEPLDSVYKYGESITISASITASNNLNKFFEINGLRMGENANVVYSNQETLDCISFGTIQNESSEIKEYLYNGKHLTVKTIDSTVTYSIEGNDIVWETSTDGNGNVTHKYTINNCDISNEGTYSFVLSTIKYNFKVKSENVDKGTIRRGSAEASSKNAEIIDTVSYGQTLLYYASPESDFAFGCWTTELATDDNPLVTSIEDRTVFSSTFNEHLFVSGGIFETLVNRIDEFKYVEIQEEDINYLTIYSTYTKNICLIEFRFAVNDVIGTENISTIFVDNKEVKPAEDGSISLKVKMDSIHTIRVTMVADYDFKNWFLSDGTNNIGEQSNENEFIVTIESEDESIILVSNFAKDVSDNGSNLTWLYLTLGGIGGIGIIALIVVIIIKKGKGNSYKNYYY